MENEKIKRETNMVAYAIKCIAWVDLVVGMFILFIVIFTFNGTVEIPFLTIVLAVIGIVISVVVVTIIGIKYMLGSVEEKAEYKKTMIGYLIGALLLFSTTTVANILYNIGTSI